MPRYFFDIDDGVRDVRDDEGTALEGQESARKQAIATLAEIARDMLPNGDNHAFKARVRDEAGAVIYEASLTLKSGWVP